MELNPETVAAYKELLTNPAAHKLPFNPLIDYFEKSETVTAKHELAEAFIKHIDRPLPKIILYIIMDEIYGQCSEKDSNGLLGYYLKFKIPEGCLILNT